MMLESYGKQYIFMALSGIEKDVLDGKTGHGFKPRRCIENEMYSL